MAEQVSGVFIKNFDVANNWQKSCKKTQPLLREDKK
jgi:hypothetical protein